MKLRNVLTPRSRHRYTRWLWRAALFVSLSLIVKPVAVAAQEAPKIEEVLIEGNEVISDEQIRSLMVTRPTGWLFNRKRYDPITFTADREAIRNFYLNSGFLDVVVRHEEITHETGNRITLKILIREGPRWRVRDIRVQGNETLSDQTVQQVLLTREGEPYFRLFTAADKRALRTLAEQNALLDTDIQVEAVDNGDTTVTVNYIIHEGHPITVGNVEIRGLEKTRPYVVRRELTIKPGELYDTGKLVRSRTRLFQTGLFRSVRMEPMPSDSLLTTRDLLIRVRELPGGEIEFGGGFASVEKFRGSLGVSQRNWQGRGISIGIRGQASQLIQQGETGITKPWLFNTNTIGIFRGFFERLDRQSHKRQRIGMSVTASRELSLAFRSQTTYTIENVRIIDPSDSLAQILATGIVADSLRTRRDGSLTQNVFYDTRNDILNPTRGFFGHIQVNLSSPLLGSSAQNNKSIFTINGNVRKYVPVRNFPDFATSLSFGYVRALDGRGLVPLDKRFFLGGDKSVRGFDVDQIGQPAGGVIAVNMQNEMRIPLPVIEIAGFIDLGGVALSVADFSPDDLRVGFGGGLRVNTPIGLIRGDIGFHRRSDKDAPTDDLMFFYFGLGQAF